MRSIIRTVCCIALVGSAGVLCIPASALAQVHGKGSNAQHPKAPKVEQGTEHGKAAQVEQGTEHRVVRTTRARHVATRRTRVLCADGTWSLRGRNACSSHDGIAERQPTYKGPTPRASARARERASVNSAVARSAYPNTDSRGAIARCVDGTYWHSTTRTNACTGHGGVASWL